MSDIKRLLLGHRQFALRWRRQRWRGLEQQLDDGPHGRPVDGKAGRAEQRNVERPDHAVPVRAAGEPRVEHGVHAVALDAAARPPHQVLVPEVRADGPLAGDELQHHDAEAVHVALLRDAQRVRVLCCSHERKKQSVSV
jgi:hypothetical protein